MKRIKKITAMIMAIAMALTIVPVNQVKAADEFPTKFRLYSWGNYESVERIEVKDHSTYIENVKSKSKDLTAALTGYDYSSGEGRVDSYSISFLTNKQGTYDISYDVMKNKKKVKTVNAKVYVYPMPVSMKLDGSSDYYYYAKKKSAKLSVSASKGNTIKKIEVGSNKKKTTEEDNDWSEEKRVESEVEYKTVKNNSMINLAKTGYYYYYFSKGKQYDSYSESLYENMMSQTIVRVTYKDAYTKQDEQIEFSMNGLK